jgi:hypothetical protein
VFQHPRANIDLDLNDVGIDAIDCGALRLEEHRTQKERKILANLHVSPPKRQKKRILPADR